MNHARVCPECNSNWPTHAIYLQCPICKEPTELTQGEIPMDKRDAIKQVEIYVAHRKKQADFEQMYADRETKRFREQLDTELPTWSGKLGTLPDQGR